jgi:hypothetical protein
MASSDKVVVNPTMRFDVDGTFFKNKATNINVQDTLLFNKLQSLLSIAKGDIATFPNIGLKQHLFNFAFQDKSGIETAVDAMVLDMKEQLQQNVNIDVSYDPNERSVDMEISLEYLRYTVEFEFQALNKSIKVINYQFKN